MVSALSIADTPLNKIKALQKKFQALNSYSYELHTVCYCATTNYESWSYDISRCSVVRTKEQPKFREESLKGTFRKGDADPWFERELSLLDGTNIYSISQYRYFQTARSRSFDPAEEKLDLTHKIALEMFDGIHKCLLRPNTNGAWSYLGTTNINNESALVFQLETKYKQYDIIHKTTYIMSEDSGLVLKSVFQSTKISSGVPSYIFSDYTNIVINANISPEVFMPPANVEFTDMNKKRKSSDPLEDMHKKLPPDLFSIPESVKNEIAENIIKRKKQKNLSNN